VRIRRATGEDLTAVAAVYAAEVDNGQATFDTAPPPLETWRRKLDSPHRGDHFLVAEDGGRVVGFAYSSAYRERGAYDHTREVTIYLDHDATGRGLGRQLYDELLSRLKDSGMRTALACISLPNEASEALHRACGFERIGLMREVGRKFDRWIDVAWWQRLL